MSPARPLVQPGACGSWQEAAGSSQSCAAPAAGCVALGQLCSHSPGACHPPAQHLQEHWGGYLRSTTAPMLCLLRSAAPGSLCGRSSTSCEQDKVGWHSISYHHDGTWPEQQLNIRYAATCHASNAKVGKSWEWDNCRLKQSCTSAKPQESKHSSTHTPASSKVIAVVSNAVGTRCCPAI